MSYVGIKENKYLPNYLDIPRYILNFLITYELYVWGTYILFLCVNDSEIFNNFHQNMQDK